MEEETGGGNFAQKKEEYIPLHVMGAVTVLYTSGHGALFFGKTAWKFRYFSME